MPSARLLDVVCPEQVCEGDLLRVETEAGELTAVVPAGVSAGDVFQVYPELVSCSNPFDDDAVTPTPLPEALGEDVACVQDSNSGTVHQSLQGRACTRAALPCRCRTH